MITITYDADNGHSVPDNRAEHYVRILIAQHKCGYDREALIGSELIINYLRVAIAEGKITPDDVTLRFNGETLTINPDGTLPHWPKGFCDRFMDSMDRIVDRMIEDMKK
jgi:predicted ATPase